MKNKTRPIVLRPMPHLATLDALAALTPALVVGYRADSDVLGDDRWLELDDDTRRWVCQVDVQAGGYACLQFGLLGATLRLQQNARRCRGDPRALLRAFACLAEDGDHDVLNHDFPLLAGICGTWGDAFDPHTLRDLDGWLSTWLDLPRATWGVEALLELAPEGTLDLVRGWTPITLQDNATGYTGFEGSVPWLETRVFDDEDWAVLEAVGARFFPKAGPPRLFLVWENSD